MILLCLRQTVTWSWHHEVGRSRRTVGGGIMSVIFDTTVRLQAGSPPQLSRLIQARRLRFFGHVARMDTSLDITRALKVSIRGLPKDWRCPPGRPRHTWLRTLEADLQPLNLGLNSAWKYTQDREHWKHLVETSTLQIRACSWWWWRYLTVAINEPCFSHAIRAVVSATGLSVPRNTFSTFFRVVLFVTCVQWNKMNEWMSLERRRYWVVLTVRLVFTRIRYINPYLTFIVITSLRVFNSELKSVISNYSAVSDHRAELI